MKLFSKLDALGFGGFLLAVTQWFFPDIDPRAKALICLAIVGLTLIHLLLPEEGKGLKLLADTALGAGVGAVIGFGFASSFFSYDVYKPITLQPTPTVVIETAFPTGEKQIAPFGYGLILGCMAAGGIIGLYLKIRKLAPTPQRFERRDLVFLTLGVLALAGGGAGGFGYAEWRWLTLHLVEVKQWADKPQPDPSSDVLAKDALNNMMEALERSKWIMYGGLTVLTVTLLGSVTFAAHVLVEGGKPAYKGSLIYKIPARTQTTPPPSLRQE